MYNRTADLYFIIYSIEFYDILSKFYDIMSMFYDILSKFYDIL